MSYKSMVRRLLLWISLSLIAAILIVFWQVGGFDFTNYDDNRYVTENGHVLAGLTGRGLVWAFRSTYAANWHPLTWLSHMLDEQLYGMEPGGHHVTSLLLHIAATLLLFLALTRMTGSVGRSGFVAALFGLHPLHVESVAWVSERKDVLSALFWMLAMLAYAWYAERPGLGRYAVVILSFALGLMAKPMLVTLPFVLLLLDYWPLGRMTAWAGVGRLSAERGKSAAAHADAPAPPAGSTISRLAVEKAPLFVLALASSIVTFIVQRQGGAMTFTDQFPLGVRTANALVAYFGYIIKAIVPIRLAVFYPHPGTTLPMWHVIAAGLVLSSLTAVVIRLARARPYLAVGWLWYLGTLVPVIGLVQVGAQAMADRYTYIPLIGLFVAVAWGIPDLVGCVQRNGQWPRVDGQSRTGPTAVNHQPSSILQFLRFSILPLAASLALLAIAIATYVQVGYWRNSITLFTRALVVTSNNALAHNNLGLVLADMGETGPAVRQYERALEIKPDFPLAHNNLGLAFVSENRLGEAISHFHEALKGEPRSPSVRSNYGIALMELGRLDEAVEQFDLALRLNPYSAGARTNLGLALAKRGDLDGAVAEYRKSLRIDPRDVRTLGNLGVALANLGKLDEAVEQYERALALSPESADIINNLGLARASQGRIDEAMAHYEDAIRIQPDLGQAHYNLAVVLAMKGRYAEAWREVHLSEKHGFGVSPAFVQALSRQMPDPGASE